VGWARRCGHTGLSWDRERRSASGNSFVSAVEGVLLAYCCLAKVPCYRFTCDWSGESKFKASVETYWRTTSIEDCLRMRLTDCEA